MPRCRLPFFALHHVIQAASSPFPSTGGSWPGRWDISSSFPPGLRSATAIHQDNRRRRNGHRASFAGSSSPRGISRTSFRSRRQEVRPCFRYGHWPSSASWPNDNNNDNETLAPFGAGSSRLLLCVSPLSPNRKYPTLSTGSTCATPLRKPSPSLGDVVHPSSTVPTAPSPLAQGRFWVTTLYLHKN